MKAYPTIKLTTQYIFKDSKGRRFVLCPAETMADVDKTAQEFNGEDPAVAAEIMRHVQLKEVKVDPRDKALLKETIKQAEAEAAAAGEQPEGKSSKKDIKAAVTDALAGADEKHEAGMKALQADHEKALKKAGK